MTNKEIADRLRVLSTTPLHANDSNGNGCTVALSGGDKWHELVDLADELDPPTAWPPWGVPIEVYAGNGVWYRRISAGNVDYYSSCYDPLGDLCALEEAISWRYMPVDWSRVDPQYNCRIIYKSGSIIFGSERIDYELRGDALHYENRPEENNE